MLTTVHSKIPPDVINPRAPEHKRPGATLAALRHNPAPLFWLLYITMMFAPFYARFIPIPGFGRHPLNQILASFCVLIGVFGLLGWSLRHRKRAIKEALARDLRSCVFCRYDLSELPEDGTCPECGRPYTRLITRRSWIWHYRELLDFSDRMRFKAEFPDLFVIEGSEPVNNSRRKES